MSELPNIRQVLAKTKTIAVVGLSSNPAKPSHYVASYLQKHGYRIDSNQELLALAASNLASGVGQGFPISGGMSLVPHACFGSQPFVFR